MIERDVRPAEEIRHPGVRRDGGSDPGEGADLDDSVFERERTSDGAQDRFRDLLCLGDLGLSEQQCNRELVAAQASDDGVRSGGLGDRAGNALQQAVAGLIAVLVVDGLEPLHLEGKNDDALAPGFAACAQAGGFVREALAIVEAGDRIGGREDDRPALLLGTLLGFVLKVDVSPPTEQDKRNVERQCSAVDAQLRPELARDLQTVKERAPVPDQKHHRRDQYGKDDHVTARTLEPRFGHRRHPGFANARHNGVVNP